MWKFQGQGLNLSHSNDNAGSLTHCTTGELPLEAIWTYQGQVFVRTPGRSLLTSRDPVSPLLRSAGRIKLWRKQNVPKAGTWDQRKDGRKLGKPLGLWLSWEIPEDTFLGEAEMHQGPEGLALMLRHKNTSGGGRTKGQADPISTGVTFGTVSCSCDPTSFDLQDRPNGPLWLPWKWTIYLCLYHICRRVLCGFPPLCFFSCTFIIYSARLSLSLTYQAINLKSEKDREASTFFLLIVRPCAGWK